MSLVEHAKRELTILGEFDESPAYAQSIVAAVAAFASFGHSGGSASIAIEVLNNLLNFKNLTPLTDNPDEWEDRSEMSGYPFWQNNRNFSAFSRDGGKSYYLLDDQPEGASEAPLYRSKHVEIENEDPSGSPSTPS